MGSVGVLAVQGDFIEHVHTLRRLGRPSREVRLPEDLSKVDALIIPGGESTTIGKLAHRFGLTEVIRERALQGMPLWGTCAGLIFMAKNLGAHDQPTLHVMDVTVERNAFGSQLESFESDLPISALGEEPFHAVFIRAPIIERAGDNVDVLAVLADGRIVAAEQNNLLGTSFHPELTDDLRFHEYFVAMIG
ncbi:MAG: pyridoxal 5'-phosphate synthase glutaminase subunit PdxT [Gammaproteobacteria bacterium]|nr:pyridoxal 5'-phosphate synthase glutaminase subunit PdxT [Gammaproteobacteria bacterium]